MLQFDKILLFSALILLSACSHQRSYSEGWSDNKKDKGPKFKTISCPSFGSGSGTGIGYDTGSGSGAAMSGYSSFGIQKPNVAGQITAGELNDLSEWDFWKDVAAEELKANQTSWEMSPSERAVFVVQTKDKNAIVGARIDIYVNVLGLSAPKLTWSSCTDNTGTAHTFARTKASDSTTTYHHATVTYGGIETRIDAPKLISEGVNSVVFDVPCSTSNLVDIAFVVDATGSMQDEINFLKDDLLDIIESSVATNPDVDIQLGSLFYRCEGNSYVTKRHDFTNNWEATMNFIREQNADEGGDEVVAKALNETIDSMSWRDNTRSKLLFIVLDEPPSLSENNIAELGYAYAKAARKGIKIIPCVASGMNLRIDRSLEYVMRNAAIFTNGTYVFFTDDSGIGGSHTLPIVASFEVEKLNGLLKRIIQSNLETHNCAATTMPIATSIKEGSNQDAQLQTAMDSIYLLASDSLQLVQLLPYTNFTTYEEINANRPLSNLDTAQLLIDNNLPVFEYKIFPNPTTDYLTVETSDVLEAMYVLDSHGKLLYEVDLSDELRFQVDLNSYPKGNYRLLMIYNEEKLSASIVKL